MATRPGIQASCFVVYVLFVAAILVYATARPAHNVDLIHYVGVALADSGLEGDELHARTYSTLRSAVPSDDYQRLTEPSPYLQQMSADSESFRQNLSFFRVKPIYPALMAILARLGLDLVSASLAISVAASAALALLAYALLAPHAHEPYRSVFASALLAGIGILGLARLATPDALSAAILLAASYEFAHRRRTGRAWVWLAISILARPDNAIIAVLLVAACRLFPSRDARLGTAESMAALTGFALTYWAAHQLAPNFSFATFFWESFVERTGYPERAHVALTLSIYGRVLLRGLVRLFDPNPAILFGVLGLATVVIYRSKRLARDAEGQLALVMGAAWVVHFLVWPYPAARFYAANYLVIGIAFVRSLFADEASAS